MRMLCAAVLAVCLAGCNVESNMSSETTVTNPDGSITKVKTETKTTNGVKTETKTETTTKGGTTTTVVYDKKGNDWVKRE
jgi:cytochrome c biogenesis factor